MLQNIAPHIYKNQYIPTPPSKESFFFYFEERNLLIKETEEKELVMPQFAQLAPAEQKKAMQKAIYLFSIDEESYYLLPEIGKWPESYQMKPIFLIREMYPNHKAFAAITAFGLYNWYKRHKFCGHCSHPLVHSHKERMLQCPECGTMEYPRISPAVIVGVINKDKILLSKYANREYTRYALLAGFAETGETIEQTIKREVMEEVEIKVKNLRYYKSQPWGLSESLLFGFFAELEGDETIHIDKEELAEASWFKREEMPPPQSVGSLTNEMMEAFRKGIF